MIEFGIDRHDEFADFMGGICEILARHRGSLQKVSFKANEFPKDFFGKWGGICEEGNMALTNLRITHMCRAIEFSMKDAVAALTKAKAKEPNTLKLVISGYQFRSKMDETRSFLACTPSNVGIEFDKKFYFQ